MRFEFFFNAYDTTVEVWYKSSKEHILLGTLQFIDIDGDKRDDIQSLLYIILSDRANSMLKVTGEVKTS